MELCVYINLKELNLDQLVALQTLLSQKMFEDILTEKVEQGKIVFAEVKNGLLN
jgi:hypothetical protein